MRKTATENALNNVIAGIKSTRPTLGKDVPKAKKSNDRRFPPVEKALLKIVSNKRLDATKRNA
ncbi:hypothetical protein [Ruegeria denitrificans]|uniref:hypothetical protein n=1 Tax=Ruegeria denitrificans TaxID=1715692 RepID=UPI000AEF7076|nr:hypothetical protein [Ruegeria denitrificans]